MRDKLEILDGKRITIIGSFDRVGSRFMSYGCTNTKKSTFILNNLLDKDGNFLCDHMWFDQTKGFKELGRLQQGDQLQFVARCKKYSKNGSYDENGIFSYNNMDYKFSYPSQFKIIKRN